MAAISTLRGTLATALTNNGVWSTFSFPPSTLLANSVVVTPGDPYLTPNNNSQTAIAPLANFKILMTTPAFDNQGNLQGMEDEGELYESIEDIWPDYPRKDDFLFNEDEY